ncbi:MAG: phosphoribosyltransferase [Anaerolineae bacterium]
MLEVDETSLPNSLVQQVSLYFKYLDLFEWDNGGVENVVFWERPSRFDQLVRDFQAVTQDLAYELIAPIEARGFLLAGLIAKETHTPIFPIRKFKPFYERFPGVKVGFKNWKGKQEAIFLFSRDHCIGRRVLIVDDLIETGNSLEAAVKGLSSLGSIPIGAFYLCDVMDEERREKFSIPIRSFVKRSGVL